MLTSLSTLYGTGKLCGFLNIEFAVNVAPVVSPKCCWHPVNPFDVDDRYGGNSRDVCGANDWHNAHKFILLLTVSVLWIRMAIFSPWKEDQASSGN